MAGIETANVVADDTNSSSTLSFSVDSGTNSNRCLGAWIGHVNNSGLRTVDSATYNSVDMTLKASSRTTIDSALDFASEIWYLAGNASGSNTFTVTLDASALVIMAVVFPLYDIDQTNPTGDASATSASSSNDTLSRDLTATAADAIGILGGFIQGSVNAPFTPTSPSTELAEDSNLSGSGFIYTAIQRALTTATTTYTLETVADGSGARYAVSAVEFQSVGGGGGLSIPVAMHHLRQQGIS